MDILVRLGNLNNFTHKAHHTLARARKMNETDYQSLTNQHEALCEMVIAIIYESAKSSKTINQQSNQPAPIDTKERWNKIV